MRQWVLTEKNLNEVAGRLKKFFFKGRNKNFIINTPYYSTPGHMGGQVVDFYNLGPIDIYTVKNDSIVFEFANCFLHYDIGTRVWFMGDTVCMTDKTHCPDMYFKVFSYDHTQYYEARMYGNELSL